jgi:hypothetical protein
MADTEIHNAPEAPRGGSNAGWVVAVLVLLGVVVLLLIGLPYFRGGTPEPAPAPEEGASVDIDATIPTGGEAAPAE